MKRTITSLAILLLVFTSVFCFAQTEQPAIKEDFKPSEYPTAKLNKFFSLQKAPIPRAAHLIIHHHAHEPGLADHEVEKFGEPENAQLFL